LGNHGPDGRGFAVFYRESATFPASIPALEARAALAFEPAARGAASFFVDKFVCIVD
jgi:hypothetical protein